MPASLRRSPRQHSTLCVSPYPLRSRTPTPSGSPQAPQVASSVQPAVSLLTQPQRLNKPTEDLEHLR
ncbi:hypothetical protein GN244_ATG12336 [Phytophthora infestans]|uniref:Uncharacterized protein n=1 Tax=Phytophthora infestans TaxID=4787 RepID=A0A833SYX7_PHYIN|nr:hypothetical protein GN244_ATG12336 [Phytophthora infestans]